MDINEDYSDLKDYLGLQSDAVQENCRIVTPDMMHCDFALHIDKNTPKEFVPRMPRSAMPSENDSCPRVTVAATIIGCYIGYFRGERDLETGSLPKPNDKDPYLGGYSISKIQFTHALWPNEKLVGDAHSTEELWLVPYNTEHVRFVPIEVGKLFVSEITYLPVAGKKPQMRLVMYVEHNEPAGLWLNKAVKLEPGRYRVGIHWPSMWERNVHDEAGVTYEVVSQEIYEARKKRVAAMLSRDADALPNKPVFFNWQ